MEAIFVLVLIFFIGVFGWYVTELLKVYKKSVIKAHALLWGRIREIGTLLMIVAPLFIVFVEQPKIKGVIGIFFIAKGAVLMAVAVYLWFRFFIEWEYIYHGLEGFKQTESRYLVKRGLYSKVRHPLYAASFLTILGWVSVFRVFYGILFTPVILVVIFVGILIEEKYLSDRFGKKYSEYKKRVPMVFPRIGI